MNAIWTDFRKKLEALCDLPDWSPARVAREARVSPTTISLFRNDPDRGLSRSSHRKIKALIDLHLEPEPHEPKQMSGQEQKQPLRLEAREGLGKVLLAPIVDQERYPVGVEGAEMDRLLRIEAVGWEHIPTEDPRSHIVRAGEGLVVEDPKKGRLEVASGDLLACSPETRALPGNVVICEVRQEVRLAVLRQGKEGPFVELSDGEKVYDFEIRATVRFKMVSFL